MALEFLEFALQQFKPREFVLSRSPAPPLIACSDAEWEQAKTARATRQTSFARVSAASCSTTLGSMRQPASAPTWWQALAFRKTQIIPLELLASAGLMFTFAPLFASRDVLFFIDNQSVCAALCRVASRSDDIQAFVTAWHAMAVALRCRVYFE